MTTLTYLDLPPDILPAPPRDPLAEHVIIMVRRYRLTTLEAVEILRQAREVIRAGRSRAWAISMVRRVAWEMRNPPP
jgi:hypothetical protein